MKLNLAQRLAVLVSLGVVLHVSSQAILFESPRAFVGDDPRFGGAVQALVVALHVGAWLAAALWLLRDDEA